MRSVVRCMLYVYASHMRMYNCISELQGSEGATGASCLTCILTTVASLTQKDTCSRYITCTPQALQSCFLPTDVLLRLLMVELAELQSVMCVTCCAMSCTGSLHLVIRQNAYMWVKVLQA